MSVTNAPGRTQTFKYRHVSTYQIVERPICALLDKLGCVVIAGLQMDQRDLMLKVSLKSFAQGHIWSQKEGVSRIKLF